MKKIIICCDGTWNTPNDLDKGVAAPTNVVRIYHALAEQDDDGNLQHKYYHPGVGTGHSWWDKAIGGGTGKGLTRNIQSAYRELCDFYEPGDHIFLFGFSRGAYTVRSLAGWIEKVGLLDLKNLSDQQIWEQIQRVFEQGYRASHKEVRSDWERLGYKFLNPATESVKIRFLGVWDTVGALGIPDDMAVLNLLDNLRDYAFHNTQLGPHIQVARHALAMDEMRASFQPTRWKAATGQDARECWFPGVHSDIGGGYAETALSNAALKWMMEEAAQAGLAFLPAMRTQVVENPQGFLHDSCTGPFALMPTQPRSVPQWQQGAAAIHDSAHQRHANPPIEQGAYRPERGLPATLDIFAAPRWNATGIWLEAGKTYQFSASGEWLDSSIRCGPGGADDGHFQFGETAHIVGSVVGKMETVFQKITGNRLAEFQFSRRHETMPWFCLVGAIANSVGVDDNEERTTHESFRIGTGTSYTPKKSGYLYAYANDAWNFYDNNRGRVQLSVIAV